MSIRFRCPDCQALMQVDDQAAGQRTQCPKCSKVIAVPQPRSAQKAAAAAPRPAQSPAESPNSRKTPSTSASRNIAPQAAGAVQESLLKQVRCPQCRQIMRAQAGTRVQCPHCQSAVQVPGAAPASAPAPGNTAPQPASAAQWQAPVKRPASAATAWSTPAASSSPFDALPPAGGGGGGFPAAGYSTANYGSAGGAASAQPNRGAQSFNPYASGGAAAGGYVGAAGNTASRTWQYIVLGVIFLLTAALFLLGVVLAVVNLVLAFVNEAPEPILNQLILRAVLGFVITLPIGVVYAVGGLALIQRTSLAQARAVAILGCIPPLNLCILMPFGIWAVILCFSAPAKREFSS
ncbi:hypothetical protein SH139x_003900 [Planctomycetaceae bacterium SH139]